MIEDDDLPLIHFRYNTVWDKVSADIEKELDYELIYNKEYLETKAKSLGDEVTDFYDNGIPKVDFDHTCLAVTSLDFALIKGESYYPQVFLKEYKYIEKKYLGIFKIIWVVFLILLMSLMKNKLTLIKFVLQKI